MLTNTHVFFHFSWNSWISFDEGFYHLYLRMYKKYDDLRTCICDWICKKGSYTRTTSTHRFHHHSIDTLSDNPWVHVLWPTVHHSAFPEAVSGACQTSMNARFVSSCPCWLLNKGHRAVRSHTTL